MSARSSVIVDTRDGRFRVAGDARTAIEPGDLVDVAVRADRISLTTETGWSINEVPCAFVSEEFVGAVVNLYLDSSAGTEIAAQLQQRDLDQLDVAVGARLMASWHAEDCRIIPRIARRVASEAPAEPRLKAIA